MPNKARNSLYIMVGIQFSDDILQTTNSDRVQLCTLTLSWIFNVQHLHVRTIQSVALQIHHIWSCIYSLYVHTYTAVATDHSAHHNVTIVRDFVP